MSQPSANTLETLNGFFKETYAKELKNLIPDGVKLLNKIPFMSKERQPGGNYNQPIILGLEHGVTFADADDDAFNLNPPVAGVTKNAQIKGNPLVLRSLLGYTAASRAAQGDRQAFMAATKYLVANMLRSVTKKLEIELLYGQYGYGVVESASVATLTLADAEWAAGIWAGSEGMPIEIRSADGLTSRGDAVITQVSLENKSITTKTAVPNVAPGDVIWHKGAFGKEFVGIHQVLNQSTGSLFNINVQDYNLWRGSAYSASSGTLSFEKLNEAVSRAVEKGHDGGRFLCVVNPRTWSDLLTEQAALRMYDSSYSSTKLEQGSRALMFFAQTGEIEIVASIYCKEGYSYLLSTADWMRVGSQDVSFNRPGRGEDEFFRDSDDSAGYELRLFTDQALFCVAPGRNVLISDIVNST